MYINTNTTTLSWYGSLPLYTPGLLYFEYTYNTGRAFPVMGVWLCDRPIMVRIAEGDLGLLEVALLLVCS